MNIESLVNEIKKAKYRIVSGQSERTYDLIAGGRTEAVEMLTLIIKSWAMEQEENLNELKIAALEAKIYVYEEIIKKSTFAPMIKTDKGEEE